jgi:lysophospholipid acyltransferase (LPLAT)-like uncharacterized protein
VWLAAATGSPLLPFHIEANRAWTMGSWDRTQIPKPFSTVAVAIGERLLLAEMSERSLEDGRARLEQCLTRLERRAGDLLKSR